MSRSRAVRALIACCALSGCNALLGIEPLRDFSDAGTIREPVTSARDAAMRGGDDAAASTPEHAAMDAGTPAADGGSMKNTSAPAADGSKPSDPDSAVHGTLIDGMRAPVAGADVQSGDHTTRTDDQGGFSLQGVGATYDISFTQRLRDENGNTCTSVWLYEGMTRRGPVFQCSVGQTGYSGDFRVHVQAPAFPLASGQFVHLTLGSPKHSFGYSNLTAADTTLTAHWFGEGEQIDANVHALWYALTPTPFLGYASGTVSLGPRPGDVTVSVPMQPLPTVDVSGHITGTGQRARHDDVWFRWNDGARMDVLSFSEPAADFSYPIPMLSDGSASLLASEGSFQEPPYALAWVENITGADPELSLVIPTPPLSMQPSAAATGVGGDTRFQWSGDARVFRLEITAAVKDGCDALYVVTANKEVTLPVAPRTGYALPPSAAFGWRVSSFGSYASVDEASDVSGYLDPFRYGMSHGSERVSGTLAISEARPFTTAP